MLSSNRARTLGVIHLGPTNYRSPAGRGRWRPNVRLEVRILRRNGDPRPKETSVVHTDKEVCSPDCDGRWSGKSSHRS
ncbi:hypothetical protein NN561_007993 [Cricetulus griseus]